MPIYEYIDMNSLIYASTSNRKPTNKQIVTIFSFFPSILQYLSFFRLINLLIGFYTLYIRS